MQKIEMNWNMF